MSEIIRFGVSMDEDLLGRFDRLCKRRKYQNRSEALRDLVRDALVREQWQGDEEIVGTITLIYDHHTRELSDNLTHMQHDHFDAILSNLHVHLDHNNCLEVIAVRGSASLERQCGRRSQPSGRPASASPDLMPGGAHPRLSRPLRRGDEVLVGIVDARPHLVASRRERRSGLGSRREKIGADGIPGGGVNLIDLLTRDQVPDVQVATRTQHSRQFAERAISVAQVGPDREADDPVGCAVSEWQSLGASHVPRHA